MSEVLLHDLLERTLEGRLSEADAAELTQLLRSSPAALRSYWECVANHAFIEDVLRESRGRDLALLEHEVKPDPAVSRRRSARWRFSRRRFSRRQRGIALIVASLVCVAAWLGYLSLRPARDDVQVAELQAMSGVVKVRDSGGRLKPASSGARIGRGEAIVVEEDQGSAEVVLDDGSQIHLDADSILSFLAPEDMATSHSQ